MSEIILERETANDESALVVAVFVLSGAAVETDELLFETENSKATQEVRAPSAGILTHSLAVGQEVEFGVVIASVGETGAVPDPEREPRADARPLAKTLAARPPGPAKANGNGKSGHSVPMSKAATVTRAEAVVALPPPAGRSLSDPRISHAAAVLLADSDLAASDFDLDFITSQDVRMRLDLSAAVPLISSAHLPLKAPAAGQMRMAKQPSARSRVNGEGAEGHDPSPEQGLGQSLAPRKRAEIEALSNGAGNSMLSVLGVTLGSLAISRAPGHFLDGHITDLAIYEASRLMKKFPRLNSYFADGVVFPRDYVHAGLAIDSGERLVVFGIENADALGLLELADTMADAVARYIDNELTAAELTRATFTVTDLSGDELDFVLPLLPRGQTLILGITRNAQAGFRLFAGFDHRVTEGREVAIFLGELRQRLLSFSTGSAAHAVSVHCEYCGRSSAEAIEKSKERGLLKVVGVDGSEVLCCGSCWNGW